MRHLRYITETQSLLTRGCVQLLINPNGPTFHALYTTPLHGWFKWAILVAWLLQIWWQVWMFIMYTQIAGGTFAASGVECRSGRWCSVEIHVNKSEHFFFSPSNPEWKLVQTRSGDTSELKCKRTFLSSWKQEFYWHVGSRGSTLSM